MTHAAYVYSGYALTTAVLGAYAVWIISRSRALRRQRSGGDTPR
ncbi:MAG: heme exporter protein CcmD [Actinomycetota bacterium]|nr:heme exporter protein CcmD [Actinomycetota bacterium]